MDSRRCAVNSWYLIHRLVNRVYQGPGTFDNGETNPLLTMYPRRRMPPIHSDNMVMDLDRRNSQLKVETNT